MTKQTRKSKRPSIKDVAKLAGVSQTTVSFVINNVSNSGIPEETRKRVFKAVDQLGYRPNALAQNLRTRRSGLIGFITDEIATSPEAGRIIEGAQDTAWENEKIILLINTKNNAELEKAGIEKLLARQVEGIIYGTMFHRPVNPPLALKEVPCVLLDCYSEDRSYPSVVPDELEGGFQATEVLINKGHRRIAFINCVDLVPATDGRLEGYKKALERHGIAFDENLVMAGNTTSAGGYDNAIRLMQLPEPPSAIFCFNDHMAMGVYDALRKFGKKIPEDVAVIGYDNQELIAAHLHPPLSTMALPHIELGRWAVNHLLKLIAGEKESAPVQQKIICPYVPRRSI